MHKKIDVSAEPKIIGVNNGIMQIELNRKKLLDGMGEYNDFYKHFGSFSYWANQNNQVDFNFSSIKAKKLKKAKMTDILSYGPYIMAFDWLISERFYNLLKGFNIGEHTLYEVAIEDCEEKYYFLKLRTILKSEFIFDKCTLTNLEKGPDKKYFNREYVFHNLNDYHEFMSNNPLFEFKHIAISKEHEKNDIIYTQSAGIYFSERLIDTFIEFGLTGLEINHVRRIEFI